MKNKIDLNESRVDLGTKLSNTGCETDQAGHRKQSSTEQKKKEKNRANLQENRVDPCTKTGNGGRKTNLAKPEGGWVFFGYEGCLGGAEACLLSKIRRMGAAVVVAG